MQVASAEMGTQMDWSLGCSLCDDSRLAAVSRVLLWQNGPESHLPLLLVCLSQSQVLPRRCQPRRIAWIEGSSAIKRQRGPSLSSRGGDVTPGAVKSTSRGSRSRFVRSPARAVISSVFSPYRRALAVAIKSLVV